MTHFARGFAALLVGVAALTPRRTRGGWDSAQKIDASGGNNTELNTPSQDGCPIQSEDGLSLYIASNRPGGKASLDIRMASRASTTAPWGAPQNLGEPVNSAADDFCPTPVGKNGLFFVSREALPGACGQGDSHFTHRPGATWAEPERLLCSPAGPNSALDEQGPSWVDVSGKRRGRKMLYFSRSSVTLSVAGEIFASEWQNGARFRPAAAVSELNDAAAKDIQPNVRADGLEASSVRAEQAASAPQDVWASTRAAVGDPWSGPGQSGVGRGYGCGRDEAVTLA